ncbi:MAG: glucose-6-phosphate isomerase [Puniceicoccales bacterium]|jgi:glucose-6-phosphate isomerase|nr:glucose-6-phosphate isomerase [Puniceicoccales bacterium]
MDTWENFKLHYHAFDADGAPFALDLSRANLPDGFLDRIEPDLQRAYTRMDALENGAIANPGENRRVGHYWLRAPFLSPSPEIASEITAAVEAIEHFAAEIHSGKIQGAHGAFENLLCIGIGGSALGPQLAAEALGNPLQDKLAVHFLDNTDPDGFDLVFAKLGTRLGRTLVIVTSKSGGTPEPRNAMIETKMRYEAAGLVFGAHAAAVTGKDSELDKLAIAENFLARFPMWDWVGGRTSETATVGLLPAALQGLPIRELLDGAAAMDKLTRSHNTAENPAALLAAAWFHLTNGRGAKDMVVLPYKDRLLLLARYLQQLVMESLGKERDLDGNTVNQGIAVYGNKGSTDQHAYVQQLREGVPNFFALFIEVLRDREGISPQIAPEVTSGDYLEGFLLGTRNALSENGRANITLTVERVNARVLGMLIALFERTVGIYAVLININAYDQPGVQAGKLAADTVLSVQREALALLRAHPGTPFNAEGIAAALKNSTLATSKIKLEELTELIFKVCEHLAVNPDKHVTKQVTKPFFNTTYTHLRPDANAPTTNH